VTTHGPDHAEIKERKRALRADLIQVRARLTKEERAEKSRAIAERLVALPELAAVRTVAVYSPLNTEVDPSAVSFRFLARGDRAVWPRASPATRILTFAACDPSRLVRGPLGALEPPTDAAAVPLEEIEAVLMPGVAFSTDGLRLGRGGGYYDATLKQVPTKALRIGLGFDAQVVPALPREPHDVPLDLVVTEARVLRFPR
jgi:5-formyltetrahydrofolate cyclo-ligase